jgi:hypothetical protein
VDGEGDFGFGERAGGAGGGVDEAAQGGRVQRGVKDAS